MGSHLDIRERLVLVYKAVVRASRPLLAAGTFFLERLSLLYRPSPREHGKHGRTQGPGVERRQQPFHL